ncbi:hypothetical protein [Aquimarina sp. AU474]|uniref:hypothetical protein n=1 Tax=Aquimarina sp. AU474 TaxID=2108529 RepID=UPI0013570EB0|nr:hypothetical protein [Aquimarina sp. AU474]
MEYRFKKPLYFILLLTGSFIWAQQPELQTKETFNIAGPGASDFIKHGNVESSKYQGTLNLSIPLFSINDKDFPLSASLSNNSGGFKPNKHESIVGLDWSLNIGGSITREVRGLPDDKEGNPISNRATVNGYYVGLKRLGVPYPKDDIFNLRSNVGFRSINPIWVFGQEGNFNSYFESQPDIFHFNVMGISGKFFIDHDKTVKVQTDAPINIKVDLSRFKKQPHTYKMCSPVDSEITMHLDNGYTYVFGGRYTAIDHNITIKDNIQLNGFFEFNNTTIDPVINTWHLTEVIAPNRTKLEFSYEGDQHIGGDSEELYDEFCKILEKYDFNQLPEPPVMLNSFFDESREIHTTQWNNSVAPPFVDGATFKDDYSGITRHNITKVSYLREIKSEGNFKIEFEYTYADEEYHTKSILSGKRFNTKKKQLNKIRVSEIADGVILNPNAPTVDIFARTFTFDYIHKGKYDNGTLSANRMFLSKVQESGKEPYLFHYYKNDKLPVKYTKGIDHWGFWNGKDDNTTLIPETMQNRAGDFRYLSKERDPNPYLCDVALIKRVIYPTKGYSEFTYEPHQYARRLERRSDQNFFTDIYDDMGVQYAGGARIKEIKDVTENGETNRREFIYAKDYSTLKNENVSSGILNDWPRYIYMLWENVGTFSATSSRVKNVSFNKYVLDGSHMVYDQVTELKSDGSSSEDTFISFSNTPDGLISEIGNQDSKLGQVTNTVNPVWLHANFIGVRRLDKSVYRGKLFKQKLYNSENQIVSETEYAYNNLIPDQYIIDIHPSGSLIQSSKRFFSPVFNTSIKTTMYYGNEKVEQIQDFTHDYNFHKKITESSTNSLGEITEMEYKYPYHINCSSGIYKDLVRDNLISKPIEVVTKINNKVVQASVFDYSRPAGTEYVLMKSNKLLRSAAGISNYQSVSAGSDCQLVTDSRMKTEYAYTKYSEDNLLEFSFKEQPPTSLLWGYDNRNLLARVDGVGYDRMIEIAGTSNISNAVFLSESENTEQEEIALQNELDNIRTNLNNAPESILTTTYIHDPYIGVKRIGDTRGNWTSFEYDNRRRLINIWDRDNKLVEKYRYNHKTNNIIPAIDTEDDYPELYGFLHHYFNTSGDLIVKPIVDRGSGRYSFSWFSNQGHVGIANGDTYKINRQTVPCHGSSNGLQIQCTIIDRLTGKTYIARQYVTKYCDPGDPTDPTDPDPDTTQQQ